MHKVALASSFKIDSKPNHLLAYLNSRAWAACCIFLQDLHVLTLIGRWFYPFYLFVLSSIQLTKVVKLGECCLGLILNWPKCEVDDAIWVLVM